MSTGPLVMFVASALVCAGLLRALLGPWRWLARWSDQPNQRSLHERPVPRVGGMALHPAWLVVAMVGGVQALAGAGAAFGAAVLGGVLVLFGLSMIDDRRSLGPLPRLVVQTLASVLPLATVAKGAAGAALPDGMIGWLVLASCWVMTVWFVNLYNFMDGANGLAGGMAVIGFGTYALSAWGRAPELAGVAAAVAGAAAGFLPFNFPRARVFLGDAGSIPLGFLAATLGLAGIVSGVWPVWFPVMVFLPFFLDASLTLLRRALRGERIWLAHREHAYQKLVRMGWGHARMSLAAWVLMVACSGLALALGSVPPQLQWPGVGAVAAVVTSLLLAVERAWRRLPHGSN